MEVKFPLPGETQQTVPGAMVINYPPPVYTAAQPTAPGAMVINYPSTVYTQPTAPGGNLPYLVGGYPGMSSPYPQPDGTGGSYPLSPYGGQPNMKDEMGGNRPPPPYGMAPPTAPVYVAPVMSTTTVIYSFQDTPSPTTCPSCHQSVVTRTVHRSGLLTWLIFGALLLFGCWFGCCLIPFCVDGCKDVDHYCPNCNHHFYKYKRL